MPTTDNYLDAISRTVSLIQQMMEDDELPLIIERKLDTIETLLGGIASTNAAILDVLKQEQERNGR